MEPLATVPLFVRAVDGVVQSEAVRESVCECVD